MTRRQRPPSRIRTAFGLVLVVAVAAAAMGVGAPMALVVLSASGIGTALLMSDRGRRQMAGATRNTAVDMSRFPVQLAADRMRVGGMFQLKFFAAARAVAAGGVLCAEAGVAKFVPSKPADSAKEWEGTVERAEVIKTPWPVSMVRLHGPGGSAQFAVQRPAQEVLRLLEPYLPVDDGS